jgi:hypothetical protein
MSIKAIRVYQTSDGKTHTSMDAASRHEAQYKVFAGVKTVLDKASVQGQCMAYLDLVNKPKLALAMRDQMNKVLEYHRNHTGKLAKRPTGRNAIKG